MFLGEERKFSGISPSLRLLCFCAYSYPHNRLQCGGSFSLEAASLCEELSAHVLGATQSVVCFAWNCNSKVSAGQHADETILLYLEQCWSVLTQGSFAPHRNVL